jgi:thiol-disulfide isomerase/thioredoxin
VLPVHPVTNHKRNDLPTFAQTLMMKTLMLFLCLLVSAAAFAQKDTMLPPYQRFPGLPPLQLILEDSTTKYTKANLPKKKPVLIMLFSPDCDHCQHEAELFVANAEALKDIHILMITTAPIYRMKEFAETYKLATMKNVVMAKDPYYLLPPFYDMRSYPFLALYDKKGDMIKVFDGTASIEKLLSAFGQK